MEFTPEARLPDPQRLIKAYSQSAATLNLIRAFANGGYADLHNVHRWMVGFVADSPQGKRYQEIADRISEAIAFMEACGITPQNVPQVKHVDVYTSHEALLLGYEEAMTRVDSTTGDWYDTSAHFVWIGDRTRQPEGAHVEFARGIKNPIGIKCGPCLEPDELLKLIEILNPADEPGRLTLIARFGAERVETGLPKLVRAVTKAGRNVVWSCDPTHGNTLKTASGFKTSRQEITVSLDRVAVVSAKLEVGGGSAVVDVTGDTSTAIDLGDTVIDSTITKKVLTSCLKARTLVRSSRSLQTFVRKD